MVYSDFDFRSDWRGHCFLSVSLGRKGCRPRRAACFSCRAFSFKISRESRGILSSANAARSNPALVRFLELLGLSSLVLDWLQIHDPKAFAPVLLGKRNGWAPGELGTESCSGRAEILFQECSVVTTRVSVYFMLSYPQATNSFKSDANW